MYQRCSDTTIILMQNVGGNPSGVFEPIARTDFADFNFENQLIVEIDEQFRRQMKENTVRETRANNLKKKQEEKRNNVDPRLTQFMQVTSCNEPELAMKAMQKHNFNETEAINEFVALGSVEAMIEEFEIALKFPAQCHTPHMVATELKPTSTFWEAYMHISTKYGHVLTNRPFKLYWQGNQIADHQMSMNFSQFGIGSGSQLEVRFQ